MRKIAVFCALVLAMTCFVSGCNGVQENNEKVERMEKDFALEQDYVYMWWPENLLTSEGLLRFQAPRYALEWDTDTARLHRIQSFQSEGTTFVERDFDTMAETENLYRLEIDGVSHVSGVASDIERGLSKSRVIESGRYVQRADVLLLGFENFTDATARVELCARQDDFVLCYEIFPARALENVTLNYEIGIAGFSATVAENCARLTSSSGESFSVYGEEDCSFSLDGNKLILTKVLATASADVFTGMKIRMVPEKTGEEIAVCAPEDFDGLTISAQQVAPHAGRAQSVVKNVAEGVVEISLDNMCSASGAEFENLEKRQSYDRLNFEITNAGAYTRRVSVCFQKPAPFSVTGLTPMLRDAESGEPVGIPVQISKNWHSHTTTPGQYNSAAPNDPRRLYEGQWMNAYCVLEIPAGGKVKYEYTCAYGTWGGVEAVSHAQLCLVGWGGNNIWEESALGSYGESVTYQPEIGHAFVNDVRPTYVTSSVGNYSKWSWGGNVGGGEFLQMDAGGTQKYRNVRVNYRSAGPNQTDTVYRGETTDGKVDFSYRIQMGRTDDLPRNYYTVRYEFKEDTRVQNMVLFSMGSEYYKQNSFRRFAYGNVNGTVSDEAYTPNTNAYYTQSAPQKFGIGGSNPWFFAYDSSAEEENGNTGFVVREYTADINGKSYSEPSFNIKQNMPGGISQLSFEMTMPAEAGTRVEKGSVVEFTVESVVLPARDANFYGSGYLFESCELFNTPDSMIQQVVHGAVSAEVSVGRQTGRYPLQIACDDADVLAQFTLKGGLGYVPVRFENLDSYAGIVLQMRTQNGWENVDQSVHGSDFWECRRDIRTGKYLRIYNLPNCVGLNFGAKNEYRLIRSGRS